MQVKLSIYSPYVNKKNSSVNVKASAKLTETYNRWISEQNGTFLLSEYDQLQQPIEDHICEKC